MNMLKKEHGSIAWMLNNPVAANLLMVVLLVGGLFAGLQMKQEVFPEFNLDIITVQVGYSGATPEEIEKGIIQTIEEAVQGLDGVDQVEAQATEGLGMVSIKLLQGVDANIIVQDVKNEIDRITTFPKDAETPKISLENNRHEVLTLILTGSEDPIILREWADIIRDELTQDKNITLVQLDETVRNHEIIVEVPHDNLRRYNLTLEDIAAKINAGSKEQGSGLLKTGGGDIMVRLNERKDYAGEYAKMPVRSGADGSRVLLEDIAVISDGFEDNRKWSEFNGKKGILIEIYRIGEQTPDAVSKAALKIIENINNYLPGELHLDVLRNSADIFLQRADLLIKNSVLGIILVVLCLGLFLKPSLALWVSFGIPVSILGSFIILLPMGLTINMMSMFAFIITLGIVVDDAIVVGENINSYRELGYKAKDAALLGSKEVATPVVFSVLTNIVAFLPMLFVPGVMGKIWKVIPIVVTGVFICSLLESLYVLPSHLAAIREKEENITPDSSIWKKFKNWLIKSQQIFSLKFMRFVEVRYGALAVYCLQRKYLVIAFGLGILLLTSAYLASGRMGFDLMPRTEADYAYASAVLPSGSSTIQIERVKNILIKEAEKIVDANGGGSLSRGIYAQIKNNEIAVRIYLVDANIRPVSTEKVTNLWREAVGNVVGVENLGFEADRGGPGSGRGLTVRLAHRDTAVLEVAGEDFGKILTTYSNIKDIDTGVSKTKRQFEIKLLPLAEQLGFTAQSIAEQVRGAFEGVKAVRQQRNRNEVTVRVRLPEEERNKETTFENLVLRVTNGINTGQEVLLRDIVEIKDARAYAVINHTNGKRTLEIKANVEPTSAVSLMMDVTKNEIMPELLLRYPGLSWEFAGRQADMQDSTRVVLFGFLIALLVIYTLLAIPFKSYSQPLIIMSSIPFGIVGAVIGHLIMGYSLSVISLFGIVALAGVVVNDSLVLIDFANRRKMEGLSSFEAIKRAGIERFRPILLTSITTFVGLAPIIFESSRQARLLIPVAISLGFGILFTTVICLILVPAFYLILEDIIAGLKQKEK